MRLPSIVCATAACLALAGAVTPAPAQEVARETVSIERYREMLERPLFSPARRGAPEAPDMQVEPADMPILQGVVLARNKRIALLAYGDPSKAHRVQEGQNVGPWKIETIVKDHVVLRAEDGKAATVRLKSARLHQATNSATSQ
jgi:type II secretory pathway component PulC